ncbi:MULTISPECIES: alpha-ketoglutarate-dependent dioxygenase AlkB [Luteimonas]|uniref:alpha-ketoglutarate-dependent dioxygenase AlkB n=1 Tax=Luteimonas TaxID=83614 RepID=UPI000C7CFCDC|nr:MULTISPECIES: alpha-ketoglutarate-dependent dioxygenase AlkB [Luteimonas]
MDLFSGDDPLPLIDDAEGGVRYWPAAVDAATASDWFDTLRDRVGWTTLRRPMYDRMVDVPRLLADWPLAALPADLPLAAMWALARNLAPAPYNHVGLNFYRDGRDSVAMHHDTLRTLAPGHPIALLSLGAPRRMRIRATAGAAPPVAVDLAPGSVLVMSHASQRTHLHGIAKTARPVGPRISVVFRVRPARYDAGDDAASGGAPAP